MPTELIGSGGPRQVTAARAIVESLIDNEVTHVFGLPGVQLDGLFAALYDLRDRIQVVHTRHEQATSYMADGYARTTGRVGVCTVVPGAGLLNAMSGLATAYSCCSPVLCISGQVPSNAVNSGLGVLHEIDDQLTMLAPITRQAERVMRPEGVAPAMARAFARLSAAVVGGPVEIEVPPDTLAQWVVAEAGSARAPGTAVLDTAVLDMAEVQAVADQLALARRPVIVAGGGVLNAGAWEQLTALAEHLDAPVLLTPNGKGVLSDRHPLAMNLRAAQHLLTTADLVLAVGTRLGHWLLTRAWRPELPVVRIDIDPDQIGRRARPVASICGDAAAALDALLPAVQSMRARPAHRRAELAELKRRARAEIDALQPQAGFGHAIRAAIPDDAIVVSESTQVGAWCALGFPVYRPRTFLTSGYQGALGSGFPTALGAKVGNPDRVVLSINGDGGFLYNIAELSTMADHGIGVITVVFNDNAYGNVRRIQLEQYGGRLLASDLHNPDFVKLADSFGLAGCRVQTADELNSAIRRAVRDGGPCLIEVVVGPMPSPGELLGWPLPAALRSR